MSDYKMVSVRLRIEEYEAMKALAEKENLKLSTWIKWILNKHVDSHKGGSNKKDSGTN